MIKNFRLFESQEDIHKLCKKYNILKYTINSDGSIDVNGNVGLSYLRLKEIPLKFRNVSGLFDCSNNQLTSLEGCPINVGSDFYCNNNKLTSLRGMPINVGGHFYCENNLINSLEGFPENLSMRGYFYFYNNPIYSLVIDWIKDNNRYSMVEYFNDLDVIRDDGKTVILYRLDEFVDIYNVKINLDEVKKHYKLV